MKEYKLSELADIIGGGTPKTSRSDYWGAIFPGFLLSTLITILDMYLQPKKQLQRLG